MERLACLAGGLESGLRWFEWAAGLRRVLKCLKSYFNVFEVGVAFILGRRCCFHRQRVGVTIGKKTAGPAIKLVRVWFYF